MRIVYVRRIAQLFFLALFLWFCAVASLGTEWWRLRGWPVNWFLQLDPLVAIGTLLTTRTIYGDLLWALATICLTIVFGRFFCGWVCPFGTLNQIVGWLGRRGRKTAEKIELNKYRRWQAAKYYLLFALLAAAVLGLFVPVLGKAVAGSLQTGLLDPIPLLHRTVNLVLLPIADHAGRYVSTAPRFYAGGVVLGAVFLAVLLLNLFIPRFYCRFVCPLGALTAVLGRYAIWHIGKMEHECSACLRCEEHCEGACEPSGRIRTNECVLCMNCLRVCDDDALVYSTARSKSGEQAAPDITRRGFLVSLGSGLLAVPILRLNSALGTNWNPRLLRPPGALPEIDFLGRCIKCGQCMRICPTNIIQPAGLEAGFEGVWTPTLNFRIGTSGCTRDCVACGHLCPTAAIRPLSIDEKTGRGDFEAGGPVRIGTAFIDQGRCLPWGMDKPCLVCQENCPVSPKAIYTREFFSTVRNGLPPVAKSDELTLSFGRDALVAGRFSSGDYFCAAPGEDSKPRRIVANTSGGLTIDSTTPWETPPEPGTHVEIQIRLERPYVDPELCIGCGLCEHECPVGGLRAIRVTAENESRSSKHSFLV